MQFQVPQFIEVEDKIFGPLTATQFIYLVGGGGFAVAMWLLLPLWAAVLIGGPVAGLGVALAFYKVNDRPFIQVIEAAFQYILKSKLYIWEHKNAEPSPEQAAERDNDPAKFVPAATGDRLKDLAWSLDVQEKTQREGIELPRI
ncbi:PrgI family protein [Patescibacteria group bacterium]|nr:PrgI family protein [Patescibacteria group bacterium]